MAVAANPSTTRKIGKQEAIRHLLHCAVRMIAAQEDPFAIHLLIHSAEKMLIDVSKKTGITPFLDWSHISPPPSFFKKHRATYNFFKHADTDFDQEISVPQVALLNLPFLYMCTENYKQLFDETTDHMRLIYELMNMVAPSFFNIPDPQWHTERMNDLGNSTIAEFLEEGLKPNPLVPDIAAEKDLDCSDNSGLYITPIPKLRELGLYQT
jgi:hypothetical protein